MEGQVDRAFFEDQLSRQKRGMSEGYGWTPEMLDAGGLHVVTGPSVADDGFTSVAVTYGEGIALSVTEPYLAWAKGHSLKRDWDVFYSEFPEALVQEGARRGQALLGQPSVIAFVLARPPESPSVPAGHELSVLQPDTLNSLWQAGEFHNALGRPNRQEHFERVIRGHALRDAAGQIVALAGLWEEGPGVWELGVDVLRGRRVGGLGRAVVLAASRDIVDSGMAAFYSCGAANIASQRTALSCGYLPASSWAAVGRRDR